MPFNTKELLNRIESEIKNLDMAGEPPELYNPVRYSIKNGGKRIRPLVTLLACDMFDGDVEMAIPAAVGIELFHNFTLVHDDIMDEAPIRRGVDSVHAKWNINTAILSGDVMFAVAYHYLLKTPANCLKPVLKVFNDTVMRICEGQQYDMNFEIRNNVSEDEYLDMIKLKTAVLPAACLKIGALIAGTTEENLENIYKFGENFGVAFQIKDDWLDIFGDEKIFGKRTGGDIVSNKKTWLLIKAFELAGKNDLETLKEALENKTRKPEEKIKIVKELYIQLGINQLATEKMESYYKMAYKYLDKIEIPDNSKINLTELIKSLFERKF